MEIPTPTSGWVIPKKKIKHPHIEVKGKDFVEEKYQSKIKGRKYSATHISMVINKTKSDKILMKKLKIKALQTLFNYRFKWKKEFPELLNKREIPSANPKRGRPKKIEEEPQTPRSYKDSPKYKHLESKKDFNNEYMKKQHEELSEDSKKKFKCIVCFEKNVPEKESMCAECDENFKARKD